MAVYKTAALQKALDDSVPSSDLEKANRQYTELTVKYRDMLQRDSRLIQRTTNLEHFQVNLQTGCFHHTQSLTDRHMFCFVMSEWERVATGADLCSE